MMTAPIPVDDAKRLAALHALNVLDTPAEERFDRITRIAQKLFDVPIALVSLVDMHRQWFKSHAGLAVTETPRDISFCGHAILRPGTLIVTDAARDQRFSDNPLVTGEPNIRFYAGQPLRDLEGNRLGTLCIIDRRPRELDSEQEQLLSDLATLVENELNSANLGSLLMRLTESERRFQMLAGEAVEAMSLKEAILNSANYSIISTDTDGTIRTFNDVAQRWLGYSSAEVIGRETPLLIHDPLEVGRRAESLSRELHRPIKPGFEAFVAKARAGQADENEWTYVRKDGGRFPVRLSVTALRATSGDITGFLGIASDISQHKQAERERDRFFDMSLHMLCIVGFDGQIRQLNPAWQRTLGFSLSELRAEPFITFVHPEDRERLLLEVDKLVHGGQTLHYESRHRCKNGSYKWLLWSATPYLEEKTIYAIARDITDLKKIERMKSELISTISHELRTPLTSIRGSLGLLAKGVAGNLSEPAGQLIDIAHRNCERLVHLVNDILDSEKIASGKMPFSLEPIELNTFVRQTVDANTPYAAEHGIRLIVESFANPLRVSADPVRLTQVLDNLLSNAVKFSPPGSQVRATISRSGDRARVAIADEGPGIPEEFRDRMFERFARVDATDSRQIGGTGLGLSISKAILDALGGQIGFESNSGAGATFYFELQALSPAERVKIDSAEAS